MRWVDVSRVPVPHHLVSPVGSCGSTLDLILPSSRNTGVGTGNRVTGSGLVTLPFFNVTSSTSTAATTTLKAGVADPDTRPAPRGGGAVSTPVVCHSRTSSGVTRASVSGATAAGEGRVGEVTKVRTLVEGTPSPSRGPSVPVSVDLSPASGRHHGPDPERRTGPRP